MATTSQWIPAVEPTTDAFFLWHVVPGFIGRGNMVNICRTTHPQFCESMRLFGTPTDHPVRLENHGTIRMEGFRGPQWQIGIAGRSHTGAVQYRILDGSNPSLGLVARGGGNMVGMGDTSSKDALWYIVPKPPFGWDFVHAGLGYRLNMSDNDTALMLSPSLGGLTHWDILRPGRTRGYHRSHFWLPPFFQQAFCNRPREYSALDAMEAVVGTTLVPPQQGASTGQSRMMLEADALSACAQDAACSILAVNNNGTMTGYSGWTIDSTTPASDPVTDEGGRLFQSTPDMVERERQIFGDTRPRNGIGEGNTREHVERWVMLRRPAVGIVLYRRRAKAGTPEQTYRKCILQLGMDAPECKHYLESVATTDEARFNLQRGVLEQVTGQPVTGLCGPVPSVDGDNLMLAAARLWSRTCTEFCRRERSRADACCRNGLMAYCKNQDAPAGLQEAMCSCYLSRETYRAIRTEANNKLGETSPVAAKINDIIAVQKIQDYCWYAPCQEMDNRPADSSCPGGNVYSCIQVSSNNSYTSGSQGIFWCTVKYVMVVVPRTTNRNATWGARKPVKTRFLNKGAIPEQRRRLPHRLKRITMLSELWRWRPWCS